MPNNAVLYTLFFSPFIVQLSLIFTEWKKRKILRQLPKSRRRLYDFELNELYTNNIPHWSLLLTSYVFFPVLALCLFGIALGTDNTYDSAVHNVNVLFFLVAIVLGNISRFIIVKKGEQLSKKPIFISFLKENSDIPHQNNKQRLFRSFLNYLTLALSLFNLIIFFVLG